MTAFTVRPATEADVDRMVEALAAVVAEGRWLGMEPPLDAGERAERLRADLSQGGSHHVAVADGEVVGHLALDLAPHGVAHLAMFVVAEWRGRGVGTALVAAGLDRARHRGAHKVDLQVWPHNRAALALYAKFGFVEEGRLRRHYRRSNGELWDAVVMGLVLDEESPGGP
jgi:RimJ/RimL family protein N-acetyltransferase